MTVSPFLFFTFIFFSVTAFSALLPYPNVTTNFVVDIDESRSSAAYVLYIKV